MKFSIIVLISFFSLSIEAAQQVKKGTKSKYKQSHRSAKHVNKQLCIALRQLTKDQLSATTHAADIDAQFEANLSPKAQRS